MTPLQHKQESRRIKHRFTWESDRTSQLGTKRFNNKYSVIKRDKGTPMIIMKKYLPYKTHMDVDH